MGFLTSKRKVQETQTRADRVQDELKRAVVQVQEIDTLRTQLRSLRTSLESQTRGNAKLAEEVIEARQQNLRSQEDVKRLNADILSRSAEREKLQNDIRVKDEKIQGLQEIVAHKITEVGSSAPQQSVESKVSSLVESLQAELKRSKAHFTEIQANHRRTVAGLEKQFAEESRRTIEALQKKNKKDIYQIQAMHSEENQIREKKHEYEMQNLQKYVEGELEDIQTQSKKENDQANSERDQAVKQMEKTERELQAEQETNAECKKRLENRLNDTEVALSRRNDELFRLRRSTSALQNDMRQKDARLAVLDSDLSSATDRITQLETTLQRERTARSIETRNLLSTREEKTKMEGRLEFVQQQYAVLLLKRKSQ